MVIKLEGGTDFDLTVLDLPDDEEAESSKEVKEKDKGKQKDGDKEEKSRKRKRDKPADSEVILLFKISSWLSLFSRIFNRFFFGLTYITL